MVQSYGYDSLNRLQSAEETIGATSNWKQVYSYDRFGNRTLVAGTTLPSSFNGTNNPSINSANNRINAAGYGYDSAGNLTAAPGWNYTFDAENKMTTASDGQPQNISSYSYDGDGRRVKKAVGTTTTVFVYDASGQLMAEYSNEQAQGSGTSYVTADTLGSTRAVTNASGEVKARYDYLPFGEEISVGRSNYGGSDIRQKFTSKERDNETGLDYFDARYYSSTQGRFTSPDEFTGGPDELFTFAEDASNNPTFYADLGNPQSLNKYQYAYNNPLRYVDPDGHDPLDSSQDPCPCKMTPAQSEQMKKDLEKALDWVAGVTGITALADAIRENGPAAAKAAWDWARTGNTESDASCPACGSSERMGQALMKRNEQSAGQNQQGQQQRQGSSNTASPNPNNDKKSQGRTGGRNQPKDRSVKGATEQLKGIQKEQKRVTRRGGYRIRTKKSQQNLDNELKKIKKSKDSKDP